MNTRWLVAQFMSRTMSRTSIGWPGCASCKPEIQKI
jgi:hypothetical protein